MNFIVFIALFIFFYKFAPICVKEGDKYFKNNNFTAVKVTKVPIAPLRGFYKKNGFHKDNFGMFDSLNGAIDIYVDKNGNQYGQGAFQGNNKFFISAPSVLYADIEHMGQELWNGPYGHYEAMMSMNKQNKKVPIGNYFLYIPEKCPICGEPIEYEPTHYPLGGKNDKIYTAALLDSHTRYCKKCNDIMLENTETYYPFYIDTLNKKIITSKDKKQFESYMKDCINMQFIQHWIEETESRNEFDWVVFDESLLRKRELSEYTKNQDVALMWQRLKVCK